MKIGRREMDIDLEYVVLQNKYRKLHNNKDDIFPYEWYFIKEYALKKQILKECLKHNLLIINSNFYYDFKCKALDNKN